MSVQNAPSHPPEAERLKLPEFVAMMGMLFATVAVSIDGMLPAMPEIAAELAPEAPNRAQLIIVFFVFGMGLGTLVAGPLSDSFGRKRIVLLGAGLYICGALGAYYSTSIEAALAARLIQGLGAAGPRTVTIAMVRDLYSGRTMARILSFCMLIFTLFPAVAPLLGAGIMALAGWRAIFLAFVAFSVVSAAWLAFRQPETLPKELRRPLQPRVLYAGCLEILANRQVMITTLVLALCFAMLFATLVSVQPIFDVTFGRHEEFPYWFAGMALVAGTGSILNAQLVERVGMRRLVVASLWVQLVSSAAMALVTFLGLLPVAIAFAVYLIWSTYVFFMAGLTMGNLNALAMEPMGHIAGLAASVVSSVATILGVLIAVPIGQAFDGTPLSAAAGVALSAAAALVLMMFNYAQPLRSPVTDL
ncbi:MAG: multidrug effflux MFS transporter [Pseudomonadota bacterium]